MNDDGGDRMWCDAMMEIIGLGMEERLILIRGVKELSDDPFQSDHRKTRCCDHRLWVCVPFWVGRCSLRLLGTCGASDGDVSWICPGTFDTRTVSPLYESGYGPWVDSNLRIAIHRFHRHMVSLRCVPSDVGGDSQPEQTVCRNGYRNRAFLPYEVSCESSDGDLE